VSVDDCSEDESSNKSIPDSGRVERGDGESGGG